jgi:hypothetical protein
LFASFRIFNKWLSVSSHIWPGCGFAGAVTPEKADFSAAKLSLNACKEVVACIPKE